MRPLYWKYFQWRKCNFFCKENVDLNLTLVQKKPQFKNCVLHLTSALHKERSRSPFHNTASVLHSTTTISHQQYEDSTNIITRVNENPSTFKEWILYMIMIVLHPYLDTLRTPSNELKWWTSWCSPYIPFWCTGSPEQRRFRIFIICLEPPKMLNIFLQ